MKIIIKKKILSVFFASLLLLCIADFQIFKSSYTIVENNKSTDTIRLDIKENWWWEDITLFTDTSTDNSYAVSAIADSKGDLHIVWCDYTDNLVGSGSDSDIFYKYYDSSSKTWSSIEVVSSESTGWSSEPFIGVDNEDTIHVIWEDSTDILGSGSDKDVFYKKRTSAGVWTTTTLISTISSTNTNHLALEVDLETNNLHIGYCDNTDILGAGTDTDIFYLWYNSTTSSWSDTYLASIESSSSSGATQIVVDSSTGISYILWYDYTSDLLGSGSDLDVFYRTFNHETLAFGPLELVSVESTHNTYSPNFILDSYGVLHFFYQDMTEILEAGSDWDIFYKSLDTVTNEWIDFELLSKGSFGGSAHAFPIIDKEDRMFVVWQDSSNINGVGVDYDIFFKYKSLHSSAWSDDYIISTLSDDTSSEAKLAVDNNGFLTCFWVEQADMLFSDLDTDIFLRKFVGPPHSPILSPIFPYSSPDGNISINWIGDYYDSSYKVYRDTEIFSTTAGKESIADLSSTTLTDTLNTSGIYYYGVVAYNDYGSSDLSNIEYVEFTEEIFFDFFKYMGILEILTIVGVILLSQVIISVIVYTLAKGGRKGSKKKTTGRKK